MDTVPNKVEQLFKALQFHERREWEAAVRSGAEADERPDFLTPIIADGDTGHGGLTAVMKLTKMFIEKGAAGIHFEDQRHGAKKCGPCGRGDYDHDYDGSSSNAASTTKCISCGDGYITQRTGAGYNVVTDSAATRCEPCNAGQYGTSSFSVASRFLALRRHG